MDDSAYPHPKTVDQLTERNVSTIAELEKAAHEQTFADMVADRITRFCGSMPFVWVHVVWFAGWIVGNCFANPTDRPISLQLLDARGFPQAIFLSTFIMISENRKVGSTNAAVTSIANQSVAEQESTKMLTLLEQWRGSGCRSKRS
jgi:uncharacterized membrane protein